MAKNKKYIFIQFLKMCRLRRCSANDITIGMAQWVEYLTCKQLVVSLSTIKNSRCFHDHKTYPIA